jgi:hypothetical protein
MATLSTTPTPLAAPTIILTPPGLIAAVATFSSQTAPDAGLRFEVRLYRQMNAAIQLITDELAHLYAQHAAAVQAGDDDLAVMFKEEAVRVRTLSSHRYAWLVAECKTLAGQITGGAGGGK